MRLILNSLIAVSLFSLLCCTEEKRNTPDVSSSIDTTFHAINSFGRIQGDTSKFSKLKCGLYINSAGILGYQAVDNSYRMTDTTGKVKAHYIYLTTIWNADESDTLNDGGQEMRYVVDTATFQIISTFYCIDKNHVYDVNPMLDGGIIEINRDADVKTFQLSGSVFFAKDKRHCYYRGRIIEGADLASFTILDTSYSQFIAFDKNYYYNGENKMSPEEVKEQKLDSVRKFMGTPFNKPSYPASPSILQTPSLLLPY